jgi:hypothetical protein
VGTQPPRWPCSRQSVPTADRLAQQAMRWARRKGSDNAATDGGPGTPWYTSSSPDSSATKSSFLDERGSVSARHACERLASAIRTGMPTGRTFRARPSSQVVHKGRASTTRPADRRSK